MQNGLEVTRLKLLIPIPALDQIVKVEQTFLSIELEYETETESYRNTKFGKQWRHQIQELLRRTGLRHQHKCVEKARKRNEIENSEIMTN